MVGRRVGFGADPYVHSFDDAATTRREGRLT
jgi:hypothetical protein